MKRFIRYLYEYEQGKRLRNVGFVKVEQQDKDCTLNIHGKGLHMKGEQKLDLYLFFEDGGECIGVLQGTVDNVNPAINYRLYFTEEDVIAPENFQRINGIILESETGRRYAAVWNEAAIDVSRMRVQRPETVQKESPRDENTGMTEEGERQEEERREEAPQQEEAGREEETMPEEGMMQNDHSMHGGIPVRQEELRQEEIPGTDTSLPKEDWGPGTEVSDENPADDVDLAQETFHGSEADLEMSQELTAQPIENICADAKEPERKERFSCTKIQRNDIARLPRCEWKWANNSFLLHGYYNYHHLAIIHDNDRYRLGVPGIYHPQEAKAANTFGFSEFIPYQDMDMNLTDDEKSSQKRFGYWCRPIKRMLKT